MIDQPSPRSAFHCIDRLSASGMHAVPGHAAVGGLPAANTGCNLRNSSNCTCWTRAAGGVHTSPCTWEQQEAMETAVAAAATETAVVAAAKGVALGAASGLAPGRGWG